MATLWRLIGLVADGPLVLNALELLDASGSRVDTGAALLSTLPPDSGMLSALGDGDDVTGCGFHADDVRAASFALQWTLAADADVMQLRAVGNLLAATVQFSAAGRWITAWRWAAGRPVDYVYSHISGLWRLDGSPADTEVSGLSLDTLAGNYRWGPGHAPYQQSAHFQGYGPGNSTRGYVYFGSGITAFRSGDFEIALWAYLDADGSQSYGRFLESKLFGSLGGWNLVRVETLNPPRVRFHLSDGTTLLEAGMSNLQWHYMEVRRRAGQMGLLIDGAVVATTSSAHDFVAPDLAIGGNLAGDERVSAYINEVRIIKGWSRPIESYTLPTDTAPRWAQPDRISTTTSIVGAGATVEVDVPRVGDVSVNTAADMEHGGIGRIWGDTAIKGTPDVPTRSRVVLLRQRDKLLVRETWSDPRTGQFEFTGIDTRREFLVLVEDAAGNYRPVAASRLVPEAA